MSGVVLSAANLNLNTKDISKNNYLGDFETKITESLEDEVHLNKLIPLDESDDDSVIFSSDSESENDFELCEYANSTIAHPKHSYENKSPNVIVGSVAFQNSSDITIGNRNYYSGPITINNFIHDKDELQDNQPSDEKIDDEIDSKWKYTKKNAFLSTTFIVFFIGALITLVMIISQTRNDEIDDNSGENSTLPDSSTEPPEPFQTVSRGEWNAVPPQHVFELETPATNVIISHTGSTNCSAQATCSAEVHQIQKFHMNTKGYNDIGFNFLAGGDGAIYIGTGWDNQGTHTRNYNHNSICIAFIGKFNESIPTDGQIFAVQKLIEKAIKLKKLKTNYFLYGHRQLDSREKPADALYELIKSWDHWVDKK